MRLTSIFLLLTGSAWVGASPVASNDKGLTARQTSSDFWVDNVKHQGAVAFGGSGDYQVYRNVKEFGAVGR